MADLEGVGVLVDREPHGKRRGALGHAAGRRPDVGGIHLRDLGDPLDRVRAHPVGKLLEPVAPALDEVVVVEVLAYDHVQKPQRKRAIGAGPQLQVHLGARGKPVHPRIGHHETRAALHHLHERVAEQAVGVRAQRVAAPYQHVLRAFPARVVVALGESDGVVGLDIGASHGPEHGGHARDDARPAAVGMHGVDRAEHVVGHLEVYLARLSARSAPHAHGVDAVLVDGPAICLHDGLKCFVPAYALPDVAAPVLAGTLERMEEPVLVVVVFLSRQAAHAQPALADGVLLVALHLDQPAVPHVHFEAAAQVMATDAGRARSVHPRAVPELRARRRGVLVEMQCWHDILLVPSLFPCLSPS